MIRVTSSKFPSGLEWSGNTEIVKGVFLGDIDTLSDVCSTELLGTGDGWDDGLAVGNLDGNTVGKPEACPEG